MEQHQKPLKNFFKLAAGFLGLFLISFSYWTNKNFGLVSIDQLVFTLKMGFHGALVSDYYYLKTFFIGCLIFPALITIAIFSIEFKNLNL